MEKQVVSQSEFAPFNMCFPTLDIQIFAVYTLDDIRVPCISRRTKTLVPWWICSEVVLPPAIQISLGIVLHNPSPGRLRGWWVDWLKISRFVWDVVDHLEGSMLSILLPKLKRSSDFLGLEKPCDFLRPVATGILRQMPPFLKSTQGPCRFFGARHTCEESKKIHGFFQICTCWLLMPTDLWIDPWVDDYGFQ